MEQQAKILDIAMNLSRIGNWAADDFHQKQRRIRMFLDQTTEYVNSLSSSSFTAPFGRTFNRFVRVYSALEKEGKRKPRDVERWAEQMMTWGNILTHRSRLIKS